MANTPKPITREEKYYNYLINGGDIQALPEPITRREIYLNYLCQNGIGGGGSGGITKEILDTAVDAALQAAKDYTDDIIEDYALISDTGYGLNLNIDKDYIMTLALKNAGGEILSEKSIDFPIESMVIGAEYDSGTITLNLQNGDFLDIDVSELVRGLVNDSFTIAGIDMKEDITKEELATALGIGDKLDKNGDASNVTATFTQVSTRTNISTGEKFSVIFGKIKKFFADLKTVAFTGSYNDLSDTPNIPTKTSDLINDSRFITKDGGTIGNDDFSIIINGLGINGDTNSTLENFEIVSANIVEGVTLKYDNEDTDERYVKQENVLNTPEEIDASTDEEYIAGALALKEIKSDLINSINQVNSNLIHQTSDFIWSNNAMACSLNDLGISYTSHWAILITAVGHVIDNGVRIAILGGFSTYKSGLTLNELFGNVNAPTIEIDENCNIIITPYTSDGCGVSFITLLNI